MLADHGPNALFTSANPIIFHCQTVAFGGQTYEYVPSLHNQGGNYAFVDGHVKWYAAARMGGPGTCRLSTCAEE